MEKTIPSEVKRITDDIARNFNPEKIVLFGSWASGRTSKGSDVDILVIMDFKGRPVDKSIEIRCTVNPAFPTDIIVRRQRDINRRIGLGDFFLAGIMAEGKVLYERPAA